MDSNVNKILQNIVNTATLAADEAKAAVHSAGKAVAGKYDEVNCRIHHGLRDVRYVGLQG